MNRLAALLVAVTVTIGAVAVPAVGAPAGAEADDAAPTPTNATDAPGARLAGVVDVQEAEVGGDLADRAFGLRLSRAGSNRSKAAVVANEVVTLRDRLMTLEQRRDRLAAAHRNGTVSDARYRAEAAGLLARSRVLERQLNRTEAAATPLPSDVLAERGVNVSAIDRLRTGARNLTGPEVAAIARSIGGPPIGSGFVDRGGDRIGPPEDRPAEPGPPGGEDRPGPDANGPRKGPPDDGRNRTGPLNSTDRTGDDDSAEANRTANGEPADDTAAESDGSSPDDGAPSGPPDDSPAADGTNGADRGAGESSRSDRHER